MEIPKEVNLKPVKWKDKLYIRVQQYLEGSFWTITTEVTHEITPVLFNVTILEHTVSKIEWKMKLHDK